MSAGKDLWNQFATAIGANDPEGLASLFASDAVYISPSGRYDGRDAVGALFTGRTQNANVKMDTSLLIEDGNTVVAEYIVTVTGTGTPVDQTGDPPSLNGVIIGEIRDGKIAEMRSYFDPAAVRT
jgi:uncharacterized protein (TIGR02246 family)